MEVEALEIPEVKLIRHKRFVDERGFFSETYSRRHFEAAGIDLTFVQVNHVFSGHAGTLRGLHFQVPPVAQDKLLRVTRGAVLDVAVDIRAGSPSYGRHVAVEISAENWLQVLVPKGFAHGYMTLSPDTEVIYKVSDFYAPELDAGLPWNDPDLAIDWGRAPDAIQLSERDRDHPPFSDFVSPFAYAEAPATS